ncbi:helix-turn-helix domain-containing protein [Sinomonas sp. ASV322]|uniref:winged helix-turn-helix transcriptional regulator n=1 Tax=Sinomonas sp. ASV322 TaxID=3041920 RepID=UPI0027DD599B|nr:helix-turn-helix domain-containing protein [Sinomonas sp. ASV322]MDQ4503057.1 helix-turn-helix domain-containing protein [Sinomonas sp. ASV322]
MSRNVRTYTHFCPAARTLEMIGDRWCLLVVRDLLTGPKRFTDLTDRLAGITPKTLTQRLRELEEEGIVAVDREPGRREVRYRLTPAGLELEPLIESLSWWGVRHAWRWPQPGEPIHSEHVVRAVVQAIERTTADRAPARWILRFPDGAYLVTCDGGTWALAVAAPEEQADVAVTATVPELARFLFGAEGGAPDGFDIDGDASAVERFRQLSRALAGVVGTPG